MNYMPPDMPQPQLSPPQFQPDQQIPEKKNYRFRWGLFVGVPLVIILFFVFVQFLKGIEPAYDFEYLMRRWGIRHPEKLIKFSCLFLVLTFVIITAKIFSKKAK